MIDSDSEESKNEKPPKKKAKKADMTRMRSNSVRKKVTVILIYPLTCFLVWPAGKEPTASRYAEKEGKKSEMDILIYPMTFFRR